MKPREKTLDELKQFGVLMCLAFVVLGGIALWRGAFLWKFLLALGVLFGLVGLTAPQLLRPIEKYWMRFAEKLSVVMTHVVLVLIFYLVMTPLGLLLRLLRYDLLKMKFEKNARTYWEPVEKEGPGTRPFLPY